MQQGGHTNVHVRYTGYPLKAEEAALILGISPDMVREFQKQGTMPNPIPDDYFDPVVTFRLQLEEAMRRKVDRQRESDAPSD